MSRFGGLLLIAAGVGIGWYAAPLSGSFVGSQVAGMVSQAFRMREAPASVDHDTSRSPVETTGSPRVAVAQEGRRGRFFSSDHPLLPSRSVNDRVQTDAAPAATAARDGARYRTVTPVDQRSAEHDLIELIQEELHRHGCLSATVDEHWSPRAKRGMQLFLDRMNARLPVARPDHVLLTLLKGEARRVCIDTCGTGEGRSASGHCVPKSILANGAAPRLGSTPTSTPKPAAQARLVLAPASAPLIDGVAREAQNGRLNAKQQPVIANGWRMSVTQAPSVVASIAPKPIAPVPATTRTQQDHATGRSNDRGRASSDDRRNSLPSMTAWRGDQQIDPAHDRSSLGAVDRPAPTGWGGGGVPRNPLTRGIAGQVEADARAAGMHVLEASPAAATSPRPINAWRPGAAPREGLGAAGRSGPSRRAELRQPRHAASRPTPSRKPSWRPRIYDNLRYNSP